MLKQAYYRISPVVRHYNVTNIFVGSLLKITLSHNVQFGREKREVLVRFTSKFRLLGSKIPLLEVTNRSRP